jgi:peptidoglycan hydrolase FlgJ
MQEVYGPSRLPLPFIPPTPIKRPVANGGGAQPPLGPPKPISTANGSLPVMATKGMTPSKIGDDASMLKAAQQFEAVFLNQLLQQLDKTVDRSESMLHGGQAEDTFRGMMLQEVATQISQRTGGSGLGFADSVYQQMKLQQSPAALLPSDKSGVNPNASH